MNALLAALAVPPRGCARLAVGYSGGLDSTVLLHALRRQSGATALRAIHVCHHLQPDAEAWAQTCARRCASWQIEFARLDVAVHPADRGVEAAAREARYAAIAGALTAGEALVTAHHADDQAETFLLQALRGAGVSGLAAMPALAHLGPGRHWRPWLALERESLREYARSEGLDWIEDPSNADPAVDRSYLRHRLWPGLAKRWPAAARTLARSARHAAAAAAAVDDLAAIDLRDTRAEDGTLRAARLQTLPEYRQTHLLRRWLADAGLDCPDHRHLAQIRRLLEAELASSPCVHFVDTDVRLFDGRLYAMRTLAPVPGQRLRWTGQDPLTLPHGCGEIRFDPPPDTALALRVCFRSGGERIETGDGHHRKLKDLLRERRIAPWLRARVPLIYCDARLLAIADFWRDERLARSLGLAQRHLRWHRRPPG